MPEDVDRSVALIEALLTDAALRERYRADPGRVLSEHGLAVAVRSAARAAHPRVTRITFEPGRRDLRRRRRRALQATEAAVHAAPGWVHAAAQEISRLVHGSGARHPARPPARQALAAADVPRWRTAEAGARAPSRAPPLRTDPRASSAPAAPPARRVPPRLPCRPPSRGARSRHGQRIEPGRCRRPSATPTPVRPARPPRSSRPTPAPSTCSPIPATTPPRVSSPTGWRPTPRAPGCHPNSR